ncbi:efflux RND transporter periplasmic adaptor subunit [Moraxella sp. ZY21109]|nr:efflux RND transporter periplasmic adaptor subunit [Moraxella sp. ZY210820]WLF84637.1 efflux RND transporter periplasmic adaptor subunit [Moraxella sp. ZY210820]
MKKPLKWLILSLILASIIGGAWYYMQPKEQTPSYITAQVIQQDLESNVLATGTLEASKLVSVGAQVSGQVKKLYVQLGEQVKQGQLIAHIDSVQQENALKTAEANLNSLQAQLSAKQVNLDKLNAEYQRQKSMFAQDATSKAEVENALANFKTAQADIKIIQAQIQQSHLSIATAKENVAYTRIVAPMDGTVVAIITEEGQTMNANQSAPTIVKLAKLDTMTIKAEISEADVMKVEQGQKVYFTTLGSDKKHYATLRQVEPAPKSIKSDSTTTSSNTAIYYNALFDVPNEDGKLRIDMTAQVYIILNEAKNALTVPVAALQNDKTKKSTNISTPSTSQNAKPEAKDNKAPSLELTDDEKALIDEGKASLGTVKVLEHNKVIEKPVLVGLNNRVNVQILRGLNAGEQVIIADGNDKSNDSAKRNRMPPR